jgi:hypothetical protein
VTGGIIAVGALFAATYYPVPKSLITVALCGYVIVAVFYAWREEHEKAREREAARHQAMLACFERCIEIMAKQNVMPFNALLRADAHMLQTSDEVTGVCVFMEAYTHGNPFEHINRIIPYEKRLAFLKFVRWSSQYDINNEVAYLDAAQDWANRFGVAVSKKDRLKLLMRKILPWG